MLLRRCGPAIVSALLATAAIPVTPAEASSVPSLQHVFVIVMENHSYGEIVGNASAPYINSLLGKGGLATDYVAVAHPSLPNYLALTGASTFGITSDCTTCWINAANIGDTVESAGKTWKAYEESMPSTCYIGDSYPYAQKHNPFVYFNDVRNNTARCNAHDVPYSQLATDLQSASTTPNYAFITPNMCNDMHDCSVSTGDSWLSQQVPKILSSAAFTSQSSVLALTWDEDDSSAGNQVPLILVGTGAGAGGRTGVYSNHYNLLKTIETALGLSTLTTIDANAGAITELFVAPPPPALCTAASLTTSQPSPSAAGSVITLNASSAGCANPVYRFWEEVPGGHWTVVQDYSTSNSYQWSSPGIAGTYQLEVDVRDASESTSYDAVANISYVLTAPTGGGATCSGAGLALSPASPGATGVAVTMTASSAGCANPQYRFWLRDPGRRWSLVRDYSSSNTHVWSQTGLAGAEAMEVDVRNAGETVAYDVVFNTTYVLAGCASATLSPNLASPQAHTVQITFTAASSCPGTAQYRFWIRPPNGSWQIVWEYGSTSAIVWTPPATPGTYGIEVDVRDQGATAPYEAVANILYTLS